MPGGGDDQLWGSGRVATAIAGCYGWGEGGASVLWSGGAMVGGEGDDQLCGSGLQSAMVGGQVTANFGGVRMTTNFGGVVVVPLQGAIVVCYGWG